MINNKKLYMIKWVDSYTLGEHWQHIEDLEKPINLVCISVGWIEKETKNNIVIIPHISDINSKGKKVTESAINIKPELEEEPANNVSGGNIAGMDAGHMSNAGQQKWTSKNKTTKKKRLRDIMGVTQ